MEHHRSLASFWKEVGGGGRSKHSASNVLMKRMKTEFATPNLDSIPCCTLATYSPLYDTLGKIVVRCCALVWCAVLTTQHWHRRSQKPISLIQAHLYDKHEPLAFPLLEISSGVCM